MDTEKVKKAVDQKDNSLATAVERKGSTGNAKGFLRADTVTVHYGIDWIAEPTDQSKKMMNQNYKKRTKIERSIAEKMRRAFPKITDDLFEGKVKDDIRITKGSHVIFATPPRLYNDWIYDYLKSDICIVGPKDKEADIKKEFDELKKIANAERGRASEYVGKAKPILKTLREKELIDGVLGRGSYFGKNGFPMKDGNINFILLVDKQLTKEQYGTRTEEISKELKQLPDYAVSLIVGTTKVIKKGEHPEFNFVIVSKSKGATGIKYEKYVLEDSIGIELTNMPKEKSEALAREFIALLPEKDMREELRLQKLPPRRN
ncbi:MAG: hypothetical protein ABSD68_04375 [Candidatus Micrarchaeales archaeon]